jgi:hypothetical protein
MRCRCRRYWPRGSNPPPDAQPGCTGGGSQCPQVPPLWGSCCCVPTSLSSSKPPLWGCDRGVAVRPQMRMAAVYPLGNCHRPAHPPAPAPPPLGVARTSCPWRGTTRWPRRIRCGLTPGDRSFRIARRGQGDSGPGGGACRACRPGHWPAGTRLRLCRAPEAHAARLSRRSGAGHTPGGLVPGAHGRVPVPPWRRSVPPPGGWLADMPQLGRDVRGPDTGAFPLQ